MHSNRRFGAFSSSENPDELASRVKAIILGFSTIIIFLAAQLFHITLTADDVVMLATQISSVAATIWFAYGVVKAVVIWGIDKWNNRG